MEEEKRDWGQFFKQMFKEGEKFTEDLLKENERLRKRNAYLNHELSHKNLDASEDDSQLITKLELLENEKNRLKEELSSLKSHLQEVEKQNADYTTQFLEIEKQHSNFASLYVASYQLHSTIEYDKVIQIISDIVINLIGAEYFYIYLYDSGSNSLTVEKSEGLDMSPGDRIGLDEDDLIKRVINYGELYLDPEIPSPGNYLRPIALLPLVSSNELIGLLAIHKLLVQKEGFEPIDMELFDLLGAHAGTALMAAIIYSQAHK